MQCLSMWPNWPQNIRGTGSDGELERLVRCVGGQTGQGCVSPSQSVRAIAAARIKTDRIDATFLALLARTNVLPTAYAPPIEVRELPEGRILFGRRKRRRRRTSQHSF